MKSINHDIICYHAKWLLVHSTMIYRNAYTTLGIWIKMTMRPQQTYARINTIHTLAFRCCVGPSCVSLTHSSHLLNSRREFIARIASICSCRLECCHWSRDQSIGCLWWRSTVNNCTQLYKHQWNFKKLCKESWYNNILTLAHRC